MDDDDYMRLFYDLDIEHYESKFTKCLNEKLHTMFDSITSIPSSIYLHAPFEYNSYLYVFINYIYKYKYINKLHSDNCPKLLCVTNPKNNFLNINDTLNKIHNVLDIDIQCKIINQVNILEALNIVTQDILVCDRKFICDMYRTNKMLAFLENYNIQYVIDNIDGEQCNMLIDLPSIYTSSKPSANFPLTVCMINNYYYNDIRRYNLMKQKGFQDITLKPHLVQNKIIYTLTRNKYISILKLLEQEYYNNIVIYIKQNNTSKLKNILHHHDYSYMQITPIFLYTNIDETMKSCMYRIFIIDDIEMMHYMTSYDMVVMVDPLDCTMQYCNIIYNRFERKPVHIFEESFGQVRDKLKNTYDL